MFNIKGSQPNFVYSSNILLPPTNHNVLDNLLEFPVHPLPSPADKLSRWKNQLDTHNHESHLLEFH